MLIEESSDTGLHRSTKSANSIEQFFNQGSAEPLDAFSGH